MSEAVPSVPPTPAAEGQGATLAAWQAKVLPFMMVGLAVIALLFFVGTFWNYLRLQARLELPEPEISLALEKAQAGQASPAHQDWYMRVVLEERAMRSRHHQNTAVIESRTWTRFMGFITGMMMVLCGCIFILGKLEADFDGSVKTASGEGALKTTSPGLVLAIAGTVLIAISLSVTFTVELNDRPVYLVGPGGAPAQAVLPPPMPMADPASVAAPSPSAPTLPAELADEMCKQAGKPPGCIKP